MHVALLALALQLQAVPRPVGARPATPAADSVGDLRRAQSEQVSFERSRRAWLPYGQSSGGRCDVRLGRFCWWYDGSLPKFPPEAETIRDRRTELLTALDQLGTRYPGDDWLPACECTTELTDTTFLVRTAWCNHVAQRRGGAAHCWAMWRTHAHRTCARTPHSLLHSTPWRRIRHAHGGTSRHC